MGSASRLASGRAAAGARDNPWARPESDALLREPSVLLSDANALLGDASALRAKLRSQLIDLTVESSIESISL
jgi:hypothetical protein